MVTYRPDAASQSDSGGDGTPDLSTFDEAAANVRRSALKAQRLAEKAATFLELRETVRGQGEDASGRVNVTVDASGCPRRVLIDGDEAVGRLVIEAWKAAQSSAGAQVADAAVDAYGESDPGTQALVARYGSAREQDAGERESRPIDRFGILRNPGIRREWH